MGAIASLQRFKGIAPGMAAANLPPEMAQVAKDCILASTSIRPLNRTSIVGAPTKAGTKLSIYPYGGFWLHWTTDVDVVRSPIALDAWDRVYWTGEGAPKYSVNSIITAGGGTNYPTNSYALGLPVPGSTTAVTDEQYSAGTAYAKDALVTYGGAQYIALQACGPEAWNPAHWQALEVDQIEAVSYVWCYVSAYGEEGPPSLPTAALSTGIGQKKILTNCPTAPAGSYNVTTKRLYRTLTGTSGTEFRFCMDVPIAQATVNDTVADSALGEALPEVAYIAPPADMKGIINLSNGCTAGFSGNTLCISPPYLPHAYPMEYRRSFPFQIVAIGAFGNSVLVTTTGNPYIVTGETPDAMREERLEDGGACLSKRGLVDMGDSIIYPSSLGLMEVGGAAVKNLTENLMTAKEWLTFKPSLLVAARHNGRYIAFHDTGGFIFDPLTKDLTTISLIATAGYFDPLTTSLYLMVGNNIVKWEGDAANQYAFTWRSKLVNTAPVNASWAQVRASSYPVTLNLYGDGALKSTTSVTSSTPFRLPGGFTCTSWEAEVTGAAEITDIRVGETLEDIT